MKRRNALGLMASAGLAWTRLAAANTATPTARRAGPQRVVVVGGAWAGLSAAHSLRQAAPELDVLVLDRDPVFRALPLSNPWLVDRTVERLPRLDRAALASRLGYRFVATEVQHIDRAQRQVHTTQGHVDYDWLVALPTMTAPGTALTAKPPQPRAPVFQADSWRTSLTGSNKACWHFKAATCS